MVHYSPARIWRYCGVSFLLGIIVSAQNPVYWITLFISGLFICYFLCSKIRTALIFCFVILTFLAGVFRYQLSSPESSFRLSSLSQIGEILRREVEFHLERNLVFPEYCVLESLLLGHRHHLPSWLYQKFIRSGLAHLIAVSGLHLTLIVYFVAHLGTSVLLSPKTRFFLSIAVLLIFVALADFTPSVIRAGIMTSVLLLGQLIHRPYNFVNSLIFAAVIMTLIRPDALISDLGFQLSFLSVVGLGCLYPVFSQISFWQKEIFQKKLLLFKEAFLFSLSSLLMTAPWLLYRIHNLSLAGLFSNVLIIPIIPYLMIGGILIVLLGYISRFLALFVAWGETFGLKYLLFITSFFSSFPQISLKIPLVLVLFYYAVLFCFIYYHRKITAINFFANQYE